MNQLTFETNNSEKIIESDFLLRVSEKQYIESTRKGKLYMNSLGFFRAMEQEGIGDKQEGIMISNGTGMLLFEGQVLAEFKNMKTYINCPIFCASSIDLKQIEEGHYEFVISSKMLQEIMVDKTKQYEILLFEKKEFIKRIKQALIREGLQGAMGRVKYTEEIKMFPKEKAYNFAFRKSPIFSHQKEWRLVLHMNIDKNQHYILDVGDISDITHQYSINNSKQEFKLEVYTI